MTNCRKITAHWVLTAQGLRSKLIVSINPDGIISDISECENIDGVASLEFYSGVLVPALVCPFTPKSDAMRRKLEGEGIGFFSDASCELEPKSVVEIFNSLPQEGVLNKLMALTYDSYKDYKGIDLQEKAHLVLVTGCNIAQDRPNNISFRRII